MADFLRGDFDLIPRMSTVLDDANEQLLKLTEEQFVVLDMLGGTDTVLIEGPAGSGKTVLAAEAVRRAARSGHRVLFTCYNKLLAERLKYSLGDEFNTNSLEVCTLHGLFTKMIGRSAIVEELDERKQEVGKQKLFDQLTPEYALFAAMEEVIPRFDVLVVDEAQDVLTPNTVEVLSEIVKGGIVGSFGTGSVTMWAVVSGFKGLENDVLVLVGIEDVDNEWWKAACYVEMSRVRTRLYVLLTKDCEQIRKQRWKAHLESVIPQDRTT